MKTVKFLLVALLFGMVAISFDSCKKCKGDDAQARIINNGTEKASVQIKTSEGNTVNINNVNPGTASPYSTYKAGKVVFTITVNNVNYVDTVEMYDCFIYDISIDSNNQITTTEIDQNE